MLESLVVTVPLLVCCWASQIIEPVPPAVEQLFAESHAVAARLKSVDVVFSLEQPGVGPRSMRLRERNGKLRGDAFFSPYIPDAEGEQVQTFDGKTHLHFHPGERKLGRTEKPNDAYLFMFSDPLSLTYEWLMAIAPPVFWPRAKSQALWLECAARAELQSPSTVQNVPCQRVRIPLRNGFWQIVEIADSLRIPLRCTDYDSSGNPRHEIIVLEWKEYPTADGPVVLPTLVDQIVRHATENVEELKVRHRVDLSSVRINPELSEDLFTISEGRAVEIYDKDTQEIIVPEKGVIHKFSDDGTLKLNARRIPAKTSRGTWAAIGGLVVAVVAAVVIGAFARHRAS